MKIVAHEVNWAAKGVKTGRTLLPIADDEELDVVSPGSACRKDSSQPFRSFLTLAIAMECPRQDRCAGRSTAVETYDKCTSRRDGTLR